MGNRIDSRKIDAYLLAAEERFHHPPRLCWEKWLPRILAIDPGAKLHEEDEHRLGQGPRYLPD